MNKKIFFIGWWSFLIFASCSPSDGRHAYQLLCSNCHMDQGEGLLALIPPLTAETFTERRSQSPCKIYRGTNDSISGQFMPAFKSLPTADLANILNYIIRLKDYHAPLYTDKEIRDYLDLCE